MPTETRIADTTWTSLGAGPMAVGLNRGRMWFDAGDTAPTDDRAGFLHAAQGQTRLVSFVGSSTVWARAIEQATPVIVVSGSLAQSIRNLTLNTFNSYADLPDPTTMDSGSVAVVLNDPIDGLNGVHVALGANDGSKATYWTAAT